MAQIRYFTNFSHFWWSIRWDVLWVHHYSCDYLPQILICAYSFSQAYDMYRYLKSRQRLNYSNSTSVFHCTSNIPNLNFDLAKFDFCELLTANQWPLVELPLLILRPPGNLNSLWLVDYFSKSYLSPLSILSDCDRLCCQKYLNLGRTSLQRVQQDLMMGS